MMSHGVHCAGYEIIIGGVPRLEKQASSLDEVKRNQGGRSSARSQALLGNAVLKALAFRIKQARACCFWVPKQSLGTSK
jgi:hypothetical protein